MRLPQLMYYSGFSMCFLHLLASLEMSLFQSQCDDALRPLALQVIHEIMTSFMTAS